MNCENGRVLNSRSVPSRQGHLCGSDRRLRPIPNHPDDGRAGRSIVGAEAERRREEEDARNQTHQGDAGAEIRLIDPV